jgi:hypothetical protein
MRDESQRYDPISPMLALADANVDFVVIGGVAAQVHGSAQLTFDLDVAYVRSERNLTQMVGVLRSLHAELRGAPPGRFPFQLDERSLEAGANFTFATDFGSVDILADPAGPPSYEKLRADAVSQDVDGRTVHFASIDHLIAMKDAVGRPKDKNAAAELRVLAEEIRRRESER